MIMKKAEAEYTETSSLSATSAFNVVHDCDLALRNLYVTAVNSYFPAEKLAEAFKDLPKKEQAKWEGNDGDGWSCKILFIRAKLRFVTETLEMLKLREWSHLINKLAP